MGFILKTFWIWISLILLRSFPLLPKNPKYSTINHYRNSLKVWKKKADCQNVRDDMVMNPSLCLTFSFWKGSSRSLQPGTTNRHRQKQIQESLVLPSQRTEGKGSPTTEFWQYSFDYGQTLIEKFHLHAWGFRRAAGLQGAGVSAQFPTLQKQMVMMLSFTWWCQPTSGKLTFHLSFSGSRQSLILLPRYVRRVQRRSKTVCAGVFQPCKFPCPWFELDLVGNWTSTHAHQHYIKWGSVKKG